MLKGWFNYFKHAHKWTFSGIHGFIRRRLRSLRHKQRTGQAGFGRSKLLNQLMPNAYFTRYGLFTMKEAHAMACQSWWGNLDWKAVCGKIARRSLNLLITRCDWLETLMEYGFHGFFSARKICWHKNILKALAHKGSGNFINRLSERLAVFPYTAFQSSICLSGN